MNPTCGVARVDAVLLDGAAVNVDAVDCVTASATDDEV